MRRYTDVSFSVKAKIAQLTLASWVATPIALGMTSAVIFFSMVRILVKGMTS